MSHSDWINLGMLIVAALVALAGLLGFAFGMGKMISLLVSMDKRLAHIEARFVRVDDHETTLRLHEQKLLQHDKSLDNHEQRIEAREEVDRATRGPKS